MDIIYIDNLSKTPNHIANYQQKNKKKRLFFWFFGVCGGGFRSKIHWREEHGHFA